MGIREWPLAGEMTSRIEFFENVETTESGVVKETPNSLGFRSAQRVEGKTKEVEEGRVIGLATISYHLRFNSDLFTKAPNLKVVDFDGEYDVVGPAQVLGGRNRYMILNCRKRN